MLDLHFRATNTTVSILLLNQPCQGDADLSCTYNRTFIPQVQEKYVLGATNASVAAFLDILENVKRIMSLS